MVLIQLVNSNNSIISSVLAKRPVKEEAEVHK